MPRRCRFPRFGVADRRAIGPQGADGTAGVRRLPQHQRRFGDAFRPDEGDRVPRSQSSLSPADQQQDQRHHLPPLADTGQSKTDRPVARSLRRSRAGRSVATGDAGSPRRRQRVPAEIPRRQAPQQDRAGAADRRTPQCPGRSGGLVRCPDQAHPRIQAPAAQHHRDSCAISGDTRRAAAQLGAAG